jgi:HK97 family phage prohead protease
MTETTFVAAERLEIREAADGHHELEGVCVPYGVETRRAGARPERFRPGAFRDALAGAVGKIRLVDHNHSDSRRPVAVATALEERTGGLWGRFRFYNTPEGRAALENVREETYGGLSIGFVALREAIDAAGVREVIDARLHHVSLVDDPAYADAQILAVRSAVDVARFEHLRNRPEKLVIDTTGEGMLSSYVRRR